MGTGAAVPADLADLHDHLGHGDPGRCGGPVTFVILQVVTNVYFARAGLWRILLTGSAR